MPASKPARISDEAIPDQTIYVKDPAFVQEGNERLRVELTLESGEHNSRSNERDAEGRIIVKLYLPGIIMHELEPREPDSTSCATILCTATQ